MIINIIVIMICIMIVMRIMTGPSRRLGAQAETTAWVGASALKYNRKIYYVFNVETEMCCFMSSLK